MLFLKFIEFFYLKDSLNLRFKPLLQNLNINTHL